MKASELIFKLQRIVDECGDIECVVEDGQDPSDMAVASDIEYIAKWRYYNADDMQPVVYIR